MLVAVHLVTEVEEQELWVAGEAAVAVRLVAEAEGQEDWAAETGEELQVGAETTGAGGRLAAGQTRGGHNFRMNAASKRRRNERLPTSMRTSRRFC